MLSPNRSGFCPTYEILSHPTMWSARSARSDTLLWSVRPNPVAAQKQQWPTHSPVVGPWVSSGDGEIYSQSSAEVVTVKTYAGDRHLSSKRHDIRLLQFTNGIACEQSYGTCAYSLGVRVHVIPSNCNGIRCFRDRHESSFPGISTTFSVFFVCFSIIRRPF